MAWTILLCLSTIVAYRVTLVLTGKAPANGFPSGQPHGPDWYQRANRAHANCIENLPIFGAVVLTGAVIGRVDPTFDTLAQVYLLARVGQTIVHLSSGRSMVVNVRFAFFLTQMVCAGWMIQRLVSAA